MTTGVLTNNRIKMPKFYCPIAMAWSPYYETANKKVVEWLYKFEIYENLTQRDYLAKAGFPNFPGKSLPEAKEHLLPMPGKEAMWLQAFDDVHCDEKHGGTSLEEHIILLGKLTRIIEEPRSQLLLDNRWARSLRDLRLEVGEHATAVQVDRWIQANIEFFNGSIWEVVNRNEELVPTINDYVMMWLKQSAIYPMIVFTDIVSGYEVPAAEWSDPKARVLREMVAIMIGWDNDLTSYEKEAHRAAVRGYPEIQNLVSVVASNLQCSVDEAVAVSGAMRDRTMAQFIQLRDELIMRGSPTLTRYANGLGQWIRGYIDYSGLSPRYTDPYNPDDRAISTPAGAGWTVIDTLESDQSNLPDLPCLCWWK